MKLKKYILFTLIIISLFTNVYGFYDEINENNDTYVIETSVQGRKEVPRLNARAAILYDSTYGRILYEKNAYSQRANASTTKMITAIVAYENGNLEDNVTVGKNAAIVGGSGINLRTNDVITLDDLIKGLLIRSGNDAAVAIAEHISGSVQDFTKLMNEKVSEIGARNTNFVNPHGLDADNHYSTAYDLMLIAEYLLNIPYLADIVSKRQAEIKINGDTRFINTTNEVLGYYQGANGVKTGYTGNAGRCIINSAVRDGRRLVCVVLGCDTKKDRTEDAIKLLDYGYTSYEIVNLQEYVREQFCISVDKSEYETYVIKTKINAFYPLRKEERDRLEVKYYIHNNLVAPLKKGTSVLEIQILLDSQCINTFDVTLSEDIYRKNWKTYFNNLVDKTLQFSIDSIF